MASMRHALPCLALLAAAGCFDDTTPSSFAAADAGPDGARAGDGGASYDGSLLGDGGGLATFPCGPTSCPSATYCVIDVSDAGAETNEACYPLLSCAAGDCSCIQNVVQTSYCAGGHVTCKGTATAGVVTTCAP
jgi:hypothetical protein